MSNVCVVNHPLILDKICRLRDKSTITQQFRQLVQQVSIILAVEATVQCRTSSVTIATPFESTEGHRLEKDIILVPILRAGLGMVDGFLSLLPDAKIGYLGIYRNEETLKPVAYYKNFPPNLNQAEIFVLDPMLATGGSADYCLSLIKEHGGRNIILVTIVSAPEGVEHVNQNHPDVKIVTASLDRELNGHGYILPGLGDAGDRLNGTF
jgi:uracil phosphoribosyltransferase